MDTATTMYPIRVRVKLRNGQFSGKMNEWRCTILGQDRLVTMRDVEWHCKTKEEAVGSFITDEIESFSIHGEYPRTDPPPM